MWGQSLPTHPPGKPHVHFRKDIFRLALLINFLQTVSRLDENRPRNVHTPALWPKLELHNIIEI